MKVFLQFRIYLTIFLLLIVNLLLAQYTFDGDYTNCPGTGSDEYGDAYAPNPQPNQGSSTCSVVEVYADIYNLNGVDYFLIALEHGNSGQSNFRLYVDTDCDSTTGQIVAPRNLGDPCPSGDPENPCIDVGGADYMVNLTTNNNPKLDVFQWNATTEEMENTNSGNLEALLGNSCTESGNFIEMRIPVSEVFDPCNNNSCGVLNLTTTISNSGGSANSSYCGNLGLGLPIPVNEKPTAAFEITETCDATETESSLPYYSLDASATTDPNILSEGDVLAYQWQIFSSNPSGLTGSFSNPSGTNVTDPSTINSEFRPDSPGEYTLQLTVTDAFDCDVSTEDNSQTTVTVSFLSQEECIQLLPIELIHFSGSWLHENTTKIDWKTASETNNSHFNLQRKSSDEANFVTIATINGAGNSTAESNYSYTDFSVNSDEVFYRLQQVDFDGQSTWSNIIQLSKKTKANNIIAFFSQDQLIVDFKLNSAKNISTIALYSINGERVYVNNKPATFSKGTSQQSLLTGHLESGMYLLLILDDEQQRVATIKVIKT